MVRSPEHEVLWKGAPGVAEPLPGSGEIEPIDGLDWSSRTSVQEFRIQWVVVQHLRAEVCGNSHNKRCAGVWLSFTAFLHLNRKPQSPQLVRELINWTMPSAPPGPTAPNGAPPRCVIRNPDARFFHVEFPAAIEGNRTSVPGHKGQG